MARRRRASKIEIVFETHSTTTDNERWVASGWLDGQLSPLGRRQAKELGERREDDELVAVFCSDLGRAVETAQIAFGGRGLPIFHDWRLRECNYGMLNGTADRATRGRAHASRRGSVLRGRELHGRGRAGAQLPARPVGPV